MLNSSERTLEDRTTRNGLFTACGVSPPNLGQFIMKDADNNESCFEIISSTRYANVYTASRDLFPALKI